MKNQPLHGIRVLAGPYCTMVLGELGADLINDELPCVMKRMPGAALGYYLCVNRNKRRVIKTLLVRERRQGKS